MSNQRRMAALMVVALVAVIATGGLVASNMGFKLNYPIQEAAGTNCPGGAGCISNSGTQSIGLPYNRQVGIDMASHLFRDIGLTISTCGKNPCNCLANIQEYDTLTDNNSPYACGGSDFPLTPGQGMLVQTINFPTGIGGDYIVVGSHNPALTINLSAAEVGVSQSGTERYTHPYHAVSAKASELIAEMGGCRLAKAVASIQQYDSTTDQNAPYTCGTQAGDFDISAGQSYIVQTGLGVSAPAGLDFVPAHY